MRARIFTSRRRRLRTSSLFTNWAEKTKRRLSTTAMAAVVVNDLSSFSSTEVCTEVDAHLPLFKWDFRERCVFYGRNSGK